VHSLQPVGSSSAVVVEKGDQRRLSGANPPVPGGRYPSVSQNEMVQVERAAKLLIEALSGTRGAVHHDHLETFA
jgi:hypothetical protein